MDQKNTQLGISLKNLLQILIELIKTWQGIAGFIFILGLLAILPENYKVLTIASFPAILPGMRIATKKITQKQLNQFVNQPLSASGQTAVQNWHAMCILRADNSSIFPQKWTRGKIIMRGASITWQEEPIFRRKNLNTIDLNQQMLQVQQTREPQGNEGFTIKRGIFLVLECKSSSGEVVLLGVSKDLANVITKSLNSLQLSA